MILVILEIFILLTFIFKCFYVLVKFLKLKSQFGLFVHLFLRQEIVLCRSGLSGTYSIVKFIILLTESSESEVYRRETPHAASNMCRKLSFPLRHL